ncbi:MAG: ComF family protein [Proteobacteria bacterium]|nr:ComF family protein [Pseudomonadota bacterium]
MLLVRNRLGRGLRYAAGWAVDSVLPPECPICRTLTDGPHRLCVACFSGITFITAPHCLCCGLPFATPGEAGPHGTCLGCIRRPPRFNRARAALRYDEASQRLILPFKHGDRTEFAPVLAAMMARAGAGLLAEADALLPVPLHRRRLVSRRYNQAGLLAEQLARRAGCRWLPDALMRHRQTVQLGQLSAAARGEEVAGAFRVRPDRQSLIDGRRLLLIDDVMTSGATASACAAALLEAGAKSVDVLAAARVPFPGRG